MKLFDLTDPEGLELTPLHVTREEIACLYEAMVKRRCDDVPLDEETKRCSRLCEEEAECSYSFYVRGEVKRIALCHLAFVVDNS
jgi:hypothetical protein